MGCLYVWQVIDLERFIKRKIKTHQEATHTQG